MQPENCEYEGLREFVIGEHMSYARFLARRYRLRGEQLN
jgi:RNA polymerase sigma-B factor